MRSLYFYVFAIVCFVVGLGLVPGFHVGEFVTVPAKQINDIIPRSACFIFTTVGTTSIFIGLGFDVTSSWLGVLQSGRNTYSLSRLQMTLWTWLILSALLAAASCRAWGLGGGSLSTALNIDIDSDLFAVMGISYFTGAAVPALLALKSQGGVNPAAGLMASAQMGEKMTVQGQVLVRPSDGTPKVGDLVQGDDLGTAGTIDLSKVQQLLVTLLLLGIYTAMIFGLFAYGPFDDPTSGHTVLPKIPENFVGLLALSHGGYLTYKALPKPPPSAPSPPPAPPGGR